MQAVPDGRRAAGFGHGAGGGAHVGAQDTALGGTVPRLRGGRRCDRRVMRGELLQTELQQRLSPQTRRRQGPSCWEKLINKYINTFTNTCNN